jgi:hypothetical protein
VPSTQLPPDLPPLKLYLKVADEEERDRCLPILKKTPGSISVTFYVVSRRAAFRADGYSVGMNVDLAALREMLGVKNVVMK